MASLILTSQERWASWSSDWKHLPVRCDYKNTSNVNDLCWRNPDPAVSPSYHLSKEPTPKRQVDIFLAGMLVREHLLSNGYLFLVLLCLLRGRFSSRILPDEKQILANTSKGPRSLWTVTHTHTMPNKQDTQTAHVTHKKCNIQHTQNSPGNA